MIKISQINSGKPYKEFQKYYDNALSNDQKNIEAIVISSLNKSLNEVESRFVNLKYIVNDEWIFFSNYQSNKAANFKSHDQISALFYWNAIDVQIRIKAKIKKSSSNLSNRHFRNRSHEKNALAISSSQSEPVKSYDDVIYEYNKVLNSDKKLLSERPDYWGGYSFKPYYFEFWKGHESRINKRTIFELSDNKDWFHSLLQP